VDARYARVEAELRSAWTGEAPVPTRACPRGPGQPAHFDCPAPASPALPANL